MQLRAVAVGQQDPSLPTRSDRKPMVVDARGRQHGPCVAFPIQLKPASGVWRVDCHHLPRLLHRLEPAVSLFLFRPKLISVPPSSMFGSRPPTLGADAQRDSVGGQHHRIHDLQTSAAHGSAPDRTEALAALVIRQGQTGPVDRAKDVLFPGATPGAGFKDRCSYCGAINRVRLEQAIRALSFGIVSKRRCHTPRRTASCPRGHAHESSSPSMILEAGVPELLECPCLRPRFAHISYSRLPCG